jgi:uncharacterized protein (DUF305 family)
MATYTRLVSSALVALSALTAFGQQAKPNTDPAPIVQPGAPGQSSRILSPAAAYTPPKTPSPADVSFMQGMIMHHSQAVEMTELLLTRSHNKDLRLLGERISISQSDDMAGMNMADMKSMPSMPPHPMAMMPGMLTPQQMEALAKSTGPAFDHLFLTGMIQHHNGALIMVDDLFKTAGAGQDNVLFDFATDVDNTQRAEIRIMQAMLLKEKR